MSRYPLPHQPAIGTGVHSDLSRLPPLDDEPFSESPNLESLPPPALPPDSIPFYEPPAEFSYYYGGKARGYYVNDQRIEFTGQEATFAVEGVVTGGIAEPCGPFLLGLDTELFLNQPFDRNILQDTPERASFAHNFDNEPLQISQLRLSAQWDDFTATVGRFETPFGRYYYPLYRNNFDDSPFIRSEAILYRETGMLLEYQPRGWSFAAALTNGGPEQDANSSKGFVGRAGIDLDWFALGVSYKRQDGIGSEGQKTYKNHLGCDVILRRGGWSLSAEAIADEYGLRRPGTALDDIFWGRSLYYRDYNKAHHEPITGLGYYVNLQYDAQLYSLLLNYGEFYPEALDIPQHDTTTRRALLKASHHLTSHFDTYAIAMLENDLPNSFGGRERKGLYVIFGCQFSL